MDIKIERPVAKPLKEHSISLEPILQVTEEGFEVPVVITGVKPKGVKSSFPTNENSNEIRGKTEGIAVGDRVSGAGIPADTVVEAIYQDTIVLSSPLQSHNESVELTFTPDADIEAFRVQTKISVLSDPQNGSVFNVSLLFNDTVVHTASLVADTLLTQARVPRA